MLRNFEILWALACGLAEKTRVEPANECRAEVHCRGQISVAGGEGRAYPDFRTVREVSLGKTNQHRRHLDVGQRIIIGNELLRITLELEGKGESVLNSAHADKPPCRQKIEGVAKALNVSVNSMAKAAALIS